MELAFRNKFVKNAATIVLAGLLVFTPTVAAKATATPAIASVSARQVFNAHSLSAVNFDDTVLTGFSGIVEVRLSVLSGTGLLHVASAAGMSLMPGYPDATSANVANLGYSGTQENADAMLATLQYIGDDVSGADDIRIDVTNQSANVYGGHAYTLVTTTRVPRIWSAAATSASRLMIAKAGGGTCPGYLATLNGNRIETSPKGNFEQAFLAADLPFTGQAWIGASDENAEGSWQWVTDPDEPDTVFWLGDASGSRENGFYSNWDNGEPNNQGGIENYARIIDSRETWNDVEDLAQATNYYVEFGSSSCVPQVVADNEVVQIASLNTIVPPGEVTNLKANRLGKSAYLGWDAPQFTGGSAVTGYDVEWKYALGGNWSQLARLASSELSADIPEIQSTLPYVFRVRAVTSLASSDWAYINLPEPKGPTFESALNGARRLPPATGGVVVFYGTNLDTITSVKLGSSNLDFEATSANIITVNVPAGSGSPDLLFQSPFGTALFQNAFTYGQPAQAYPEIIKRFSGVQWSSAAASRINDQLLNLYGYSRVSCEIHSVPSVKALEQIVKYFRQLKISTYFTHVKIRDLRNTKKSFAKLYDLKFIINR